MLARHLEADAEREDVEGVDDLVADDETRAAVAREADVLGRDELQKWQEQLLDDRLL